MQVPPNIPLQDSIRAALAPRASRVLTFNELARQVLPPDASEAAREELRSAVGELERRGDVVRVRGEKLSLIENTDYQAGAIAIRGEGKAWLLSGERGVPDTPIARGGLASSLDGDFVLCRIDKPKKARGARGNLLRSSATVVKVLVRRRESVVGKIARGPDGIVLVPFDRKIDALLTIPPGKDLDAPEGIFVEARILAYPDDRRLAVAEVIERIGFEGDPGVDVEVVARKWGIPRVFPEAAVKEAEAFGGGAPPPAPPGVRGVGSSVAAAAASPELTPDERARRTDFTGRVIVTIDGETARDFDDAIEAEELPNGGFRVGIHIADVSYYVKPGTHLDAEAFERGTSVYFPDRAIHMLPERLSADLCSLRANEEKRVVSALLTLAPSGETVKSEFFRGVIRSRQRLTYTAVGAFFDSGNAEAAGILPDVAAMLPVARKAAELLRRRRAQRGSLDFDLPDADVILGETGDIVAITKAVRNEAHRLIEELMLAANEAVAKHLLFLPSPTLYRVHDQPSEARLVDLRAVLQPLGYHIPEDVEEVKPAVFQAILDQAEGKPEERFVSDLVLRAQMKALYSHECRGHYALATPYYGHFTSPIRRYPDLLVHRALTDWIETKRPPQPEEAEVALRWLQGLAGPQCSARERRAESAEREAIAWKKFVFLSKRVGEEFDAYVSAVVPFGLFVTLDQIYVDGLIAMDQLQDDFYRYEEVEHRLVGSGFGRVFRLGDRLRVKLIRADADKRGLDFAPAGESAGPRRKARVDWLDRQPARSGSAGAAPGGSAPGLGSRPGGPRRPGARGPGTRGPAPGGPGAPKGGRGGRGPGSGRKKR